MLSVDNGIEVDTDLLDSVMRDRFPFLIEAARSARTSTTWRGDIRPVIERRYQTIVAEYHRARRDLIKNDTEVKRLLHAYSGHSILKDRAA